MNYYIKAKVKFNGVVLRLTHAGHQGMIHVYTGTEKAFKAKSDYVSRLKELGYYDIEAKVVALSIWGK